MEQKNISKEELIRVSKKIIIEEGISSFSMRKLAKKCKISVGSIYNYFPSKIELLNEIIENVWDEIFFPIFEIKKIDNFNITVLTLFELIKKGNKKFPEFFNLHSIHFASEEKEQGRKLMHEYFSKVQKLLIISLENDEKIKKESINNGCSKEKFAEYILNLIIMALLKNEKEIDSLLSMIDWYLYR